MCVVCVCSSLLRYECMNACTCLSYCNPIAQAANALIRIEFIERWNLALRLYECMYLILLYYVMNACTCLPYCNPIAQTVNALIRIDRIPIDVVIVSSNGTSSTRILPKMHFNSNDKQSTRSHEELQHCSHWHFHHHPSLHHHHSFPSSFHHP